MGGLSESASENNNIIMFAFYLVSVQQLLLRFWLAPMKVSAFDISFHKLFWRQNTIVLDSLHDSCSSVDVIEWVSELQSRLLSFVVFKMYSDDQNEGMA